MINEIIAQRIAVARYPHDEARESHPRAGPIIRDIPNTAPFNPNTFDRSSGFDMSASIACATDIFHPVIPSKTLETKIIKIGRVKIHILSSGIKYAAAKTNQLKNVPN